MSATPPPANLEHRDPLPDYYLGYLIFYDEFSEDNCKWVVYDGMSRVRCPTRRGAIDYITDRAGKNKNPDFQTRIIDARISLNRAITQLDSCAELFDGIARLQLERLAVRLKPVLVDIDNIVLN